MNNIIAVPLKQINGVNFGSDREVLRMTFGEFTEFKKTKLSENTSDNFGFCHVFYDKNNKFEAIEIFDANVYINGQLIFPTSLSNIQNIIPAIIKGNDELICIENSISVYAPYGKPESILFACSGYFN